jgi:hypothetical protein
MCQLGCASPDVQLLFKVPAYLCDYCVTIVSGHKVLDLAGSGGLEVVTSNEVRCKVKFGGIRGWAAICVSAICAIAHWHVCRSRNSHIDAVGKTGE